MATNKLQLQVLLSALDKASGPLKKSQGSSVCATRELRAARDRLKELNRTQDDNRSWRTQRAAATQTAAGLQAAQANLTRQDGDQHSYLEADRDSYDGVRAYYYDVNSAKKQDVIAGSGENLKELRHTYSDRERALRAVRAHWRQLQRSTRTLRYTLALGRLELIPEMTYTLSGVKRTIDAIVWHGGNVAHSLTADGGRTTTLALEAQLPEAEVTDLADEHTQHYTGVVAWYRVKGGKEEKVTAGDQATPRRLTHLYASKATAKRAVEREYCRLNNQHMNRHSYTID